MIMYRRVAVVVLLVAGAEALGERPFGLTQRVPWTSSRVVGTPEPPHPYRIERAFTKLTFHNPVLMTRAPGLRRWFVGEQDGKLYSFAKEPGCDKAELFFDPRNELKSWDRTKVRGLDAVYALAFHPQFAKNRFCYIMYVLGGKDNARLPEGSRVSRFRVTDTDPPRVEASSEKVIIAWLAGGHNGCDMHFGPDGCLYISTGDGANPNPPDSLDTGQDCSDLLSSILRIDVDREEEGRAYAVPPDNPFVKTPNVRPEIWAYGFRNPWRMSFDRASGDLWVGDVGWELWEMVYRVQRGGNYGWSVMEGRQVVRPNAKLGPTPILPPTLDFPHTEAISITGGFVYHGKRLKELQGAYVCGDWGTRKLWGTRFQGDKIVKHQELAQGNVRVVGFGEDDDGELYFLDHNEAGGIYQLVPNEAAQQKQPPFPRRLSETGLFASVQDQAPAPGVLPFAVNAEQWLDHAGAQRFVAVPGRDLVKIYDRFIPADGFYRGQVFFPKDSVLAKTITLELERGKPGSSKKIETQLLHFDGTLWRGYSYEWNDAQTDATLVGAAGLDRTIAVVDPQAPGGKRQQTWHFPSRTECVQCHNPWAGYALAFNPLQLNRDFDYGGTVDNQLRAMRHIGLVELLERDEDSPHTRTRVELPSARLANPYDAGADVTPRARAYLHVNCAHCHQFGAGGTALIDLRHDVALEDMKALEERPVQGNFDIDQAQVLYPGDPYRSILYYRMAKLGGGRMPHIGSTIVDERGLRLIHDWIRQVPPHKDERVLIERLRSLDETTALEQEKADLPGRIERAARALARRAGRSEPTAQDLRDAERQEKNKLTPRIRTRAADRVKTIERLLATTGGALHLERAVADERLPAGVRAQVLTAALANPAPQVRDLFERFIPDEQRVRRLGSTIRPEQILSLKGDAGRGRELFFKMAGLQCANCHRVGGTGSTLGPDLSQLAARFNRAQILESILEPSKNIDPKYATYLVETSDGKTQSGLLASRSESELILKLAGDKEVRIPARDVTTLAPLRTSLMPDGLLRDLTAEQAADLLEFLATLK
jgi:putative heme-binding domain-containing protein